MKFSRTIRLLDHFRYPSSRASVISLFVASPVIMMTGSGLIYRNESVEPSIPFIFGNRTRGARHPGALEARATGHAPTPV